MSKISDQIESILQEENAEQTIQNTMKLIADDVLFRTMFFNAIGPAVLLLGKAEIENLKVAIATTYLLGIRQGEMNALLRMEGE